MVVSCDFHYAGCEVQLVRQNMATHLAESLAAHVSLLTTQTQMLAYVDRQNNLLLHLSVLALQQLTNLAMQQKETLEVLRKENEALKQKVNKDGMRHDDSLAELQKYVGMLPPIKLTVNEFARRKASNEQWYSSSFYTHLRGYKMCLRVDANGCGDGKGTHVSVYAYLIRGEYDDLLKWPFQGSIVVQLCNQLEDKHHCTDTIDFSETADPEVISRVTNGERAEAGWGISTLIAHKDLDFKQVNNFQYLKDNCLYFRIITVESLSEAGVLPMELTMTNFEQHKVDSDDWYSPPFYTHPQGYKMCLCVYANGCSDGKGTHVSVFAYLMRGEFDNHLKLPFRGHVTVSLLNWLEVNKHTTRTITFTNNKSTSEATDEEQAGGRGYSTFIAHSDLKYSSIKNSQYLKYDCLHFRIAHVELNLNA